MRVLEEAMAWCTVRTRWAWTWAMTICAGPGQRSVAWTHPDGRRPPSSLSNFLSSGQTRPIVSRRTTANGPDSAVGSESNEGPSRADRLGTAPTAMQDAADGTGFSRAFCHALHGNPMLAMAYHAAS